MPDANTASLVSQLGELKNQFAPINARRIRSLLERLSKAQIHDLDSLIQFHETLLFLRAYPQSAAIVRASEAILSSFPARISMLRDRNLDMSRLVHPDISGIAGTAVTDTFSFHIVRWLLEIHHSQVAFEWEWFEDEGRLADAWPRFMPLLQEDTFVEANIPYHEWLRFARNGRSEAGWLVDRFNRLPLSEAEKSELYNSQKLYVRWAPSYRATRTGMRLPTKRVFYHRTALIARRDVRFKEELTKPAPALRKLSKRQGKKAADMARAASTIRYRELYGFTHGDPTRVYRTDLGRGVDLFVMGLPPDNRLPLRAYHAAMIYKNAVPIGYFEGLSLFERMESGFNMYYTFRDGETAWLYARTLNVMRHLAGVTTFFLDPYQIGFENEEGIASGAFWFYRKLGFRSTRRALRRLTEREEEKIGNRTNYRTSAATLRKLAEAPMILQLREEQTGDWDRFQIRKIALKVQREMARRFGGDARRMREACISRVERELEMCIASLDQMQLKVFADWAVVLSLISDLRTWSVDDKLQLLKIVEAKAGVDESRYLRVMQRHERLRGEIIRLGS